MGWFGEVGAIKGPKKNNWFTVALIASFFPLGIEQKAARKNEVQEN